MPLGPAQTSSISAIERSNGAETVAFLTQPTPRFHGAVPAMLEEVKKLIAGKAGGFCSPSPTPAKSNAWPTSSTSTTFRSAWAAAPAAAKAMPTKPATSRAKCSPQRLVKAYVPDGVAAAGCRPRHFRRARSLRRVRIGSVSRRSAQKSKVSAFLSDFRDLPVGDYVVHVEHGIGQYQGLKEITQGDGRRRIHAAGVCRRRAPLCSADPPRPGPEIPLVRRREARAEPSGHRSTGPRRKRASRRP